MAAQTGRFRRNAPCIPRLSGARSVRGGQSRVLRLRVILKGRPRLALVVPFLQDPVRRTLNPALARSPRDLTPGRRSELQRWPALGLQKTNYDSRSRKRGLCPKPSILPDLVPNTNSAPPARRSPEPSTFDSGSGKEEAK